MQNVHQELINRYNLQGLVTERLDFLPKSNAENENGREMAFDAETVEAIPEFYEGRREALFENRHRFTMERLLAYLKATHRYYPD